MVEEVLTYDSTEESRKVDWRSVVNKVGLSKGIKVREQ